MARNQLVKARSEALIEINFVFTDFFFGLRHGLRRKEGTARSGNAVILIVKILLFGSEIFIQV